MPEINILEHINLKETQIDRQNLIIKDVAILNEMSLNRRRYSPKALDDATRVFENAPSYCNHSDGKRDVRNLLGRFQGLKKVGNGVKGNLQLLEHSKWLLDVAERMPDVVGFSISAIGNTRKEGDIEVVESIRKGAGTSVDLVSDPATTKSLFEDKQMPEENKTTEQKTTEKATKENQLLEENLKKLEAESQKLKEEQAKLQEENKKLLEQKRVMDLKTQAMSKLPAYAISDVLVEALSKIEHPEKLIEAQLALIQEVKKTFTINPPTQNVSTTKSIREMVK